MKSAHRHELETNTLAHRLEEYIERYRPYASRIVGGLIALVLVILIVSYLSGLSSSKQSQAWDAFNLAVAANPPDLKLIHQTAQDYPGTSMQQLADVTWADSQVYVASRTYLSNRKAANEALGKAASVYQGVVQSSKDEHLTSRAHLGLARAYEMQNQLQEARSEYGKVKGVYEQYAQQQIERLDKPEAKDTYAWLASAPIPERKSTGPATTSGQNQELSPSDISLPGVPGADSGKAGDSKGAADTFENLMKTMQTEGKIGEPKKGTPAEASKSDAKSTAPASPEAKSSTVSPPSESKNAPNAKSDSPSPPTSSESKSAAPPKPPAAGDKSAK
jgi:hypothetical protein